MEADAPPGAPVQPAPAPGARVEESPEELQKEGPEKFAVKIDIVKLVQGIQKGAFGYKDKNLMKKLLVQQGQSEGSIPGHWGSAPDRVITALAKIARTPADVNRWWFQDPELLAQTDSTGLTAAHILALNSEKTGWTMDDARTLRLKTQGLPDANKNWKYLGVALPEDVKLAAVGDWVAHYLFKFSSNWYTPQYEDYLIIPDGRNQRPGDFLCTRMGFPPQYFQKLLTVLTTPVTEAEVNDVLNTETLGKMTDKAFHKWVVDHDINITDYTPPAQETPPAEGARPV